MPTTTRTASMTSGSLKIDGERFYLKIDYDAPDMDGGSEPRGRHLRQSQCYAGVHSRARLCASASCSGVSCFSIRSRLLMAVLRRGSAALKCAAARLNHIYALTKSGCLPACPLE